MGKARFAIGPTPEEEAAKDFVPYVLSASERTQAARADLHLENLRRDWNRRDDARALAGVLWMEEQ